MKKGLIILGVIILSVFGLYRLKHLIPEPIVYTEIEKKSEVYVNNQSGYSFIIPNGVSIESGDFGVVTQDSPTIHIYQKNDDGTDIVVGTIKNISQLYTDSNELTSIQNLNQFDIWYLDNFISELSDSITENLKVSDSEELYFNGILTRKRTLTISNSGILDRSSTWLQFSYNDEYYHVEFDTNNELVKELIFTMKFGTDK